VQIGDEFKEFGTKAEAEKALTKDEFDKSGQKYQIIGDTFYYRDKNDEVQTKPMSEIEDKQYDLNYTLKLEQAKRNDDLQGWFKLQDDYLAKLETEYKSLDPDNPLDQLRMIEIENKVGDISEKYSKYKGYGGFKKPKSYTSKIKSVKGIKIKTPKLYALKTKMKTYNTKKVAIKATPVKARVRAKSAKGTNNVRPY